MEESRAPADLIPAPHRATSKSGRPAPRALVWEVSTVIIALSVITAAIALPQMIGTSPVAGPAQVLPGGGPNIVGLFPYDGPSDAQAIHAACVVAAVVDYDCIAEALDGLLGAQGAEIAFRVLEDLTLLDPNISAQGHALAHGLGRVALEDYGGPIVALRHCPYVLSSGCFHGVQQSYFDTLPQPLDPFVVQNICPADDHSWQFQCLHGLGHGLLLFTNYAMNRSLEYCDLLGTNWEMVSCYGGVFMENLAGWHDAQNPAADGGAGHNHGGVPRPPPVYMIRLGDPGFPCNVLAERYLGSCYFIQASVALRVTGEDATAVAAMCRSAPPNYRQICFMSYGRDVATNTNRDPYMGSSRCLALQAEEANDCVRGYIMDVLNVRSDLADGVPHCTSVDSRLGPTCFQQLGAYGRDLVSTDALRVFCESLAEPGRSYCLQGAGI